MPPPDVPADDADATRASAPTGEGEGGSSLTVDLFDQPGHLIRRAQQISVSMFLDAVGRDVTPIQYAVLRTLQERPGIDQVTLASAAALDTSTTAELAARLESKGWIRRELRARRQRSLTLTDAGRDILARLLPGIHALNNSMLSSLSAPERAEFMRLLRKFVQINNAVSRAPQQPPDATA